MRTQTLEEQFWKYHRANPDVFRLFAKYAFEVKSAGFKRYSARAIIHRIRWHVDMATTDPNHDGFKISNNHSPYYARLLQAKYPLEFEDFFVMHESVTLTIPPGEFAPQRRFF